MAADRPPVSARTAAGQLARLRPNWLRLAEELGFPLELDLGSRLERAALTASAHAHGLGPRNEPLSGWAQAPYRTIIHGDPKSPNFFFKGGEGEEEGAGGVQDGCGAVGMIDLQWCGTG